MAAKAKVIDHVKMVELAKVIKEKHALINRESDELDTLKKGLIDLAKIEFFSSIKCKLEGTEPVELVEGTPEVYGNFELPVDNNDKVTINFQTGSKSFKKIDGKPAPSILKGIFGDDYEKIFEELVQYEVIATEPELDKQSEERPGLFGYSIKPDADSEELRKIYSNRPDLFQRQVIDLEKYALAYPDKVKSETKVTLGKGFLEKVGKLDGHVLQSGKSFLAGLFSAVLKVVIKCGNANKK